MTFSTDSNCMVAMLMPEHEHHSRAVLAVNQRLDHGEAWIVVAHTLLETYATLTTYPLPHRVGPHEAVSAIERTFFTKATIAAFHHDQYAMLLYDMANRQVLGRQVYDAAIAGTARSAGVQTLLTFNERHFRRFEGDGLTVVVP